MVFQTETDFESALIDKLKKHGWEDKVLENSTEDDLLQNWADILYENNRSIDKLDDYPLTKGEMRQIIEQINTLKTPSALNTFINGKTVGIKRDNPDDKRHFGKEVSLKIYDRQEIAAGQSRYQIVRQPRFKSKSKVLNDRRGDIMLLINGMPVFHIELKKSGVPVIQGANQIEKYSQEGVYSGIFSLVQIFVAMNPEETLYFANPGADGVFNPNYYFHWANFNNEPINEWSEIVSTLLSIPMAHQMIGFYTIPDDTDGILKVLRSYQYYASNAISDRVSKNKWDERQQLGGYIWHTTGSGKTMTSFKSAQLIANSKDADKVVFLMDRIELGTQSLNEYKNFADDGDDVQGTEDTKMLIAKLKSPQPADTLIVTSIQKMDNVKPNQGELNANDIEEISKKRIVFIVDEAHRSTFGDMLAGIKKTFPNALFFGFTGTPIDEENKKKENTTSTLFGNELHRYSIADGIRDKNVLGFDPYKILTFKDRDLRKVVALQEAKAKDEDEALNDPKKSKTYYKYMDSKKVPMAGHKEKNGKKVKGIEDFIPKSQYSGSQHHEAVVSDIISNFNTLSHNKKFHAIFACASIKEAVAYYKLFKEKDTDLKITALFDPSIDNNGGTEFKREGLEELICDYNDMYEQDFTLATFQKLKKDISNRLAHKGPYLRIHNDPKKQIDILIVVDQMLTGFDSKWVNTLYLDKTMAYENVIQAFSRTNRLFGPDKPFGIIRYYRKPHTMEKNIDAAVKLYSGDKPFGLFVDKLAQNVRMINSTFNDIKTLLGVTEISDLTVLPDDTAVCAKFVKSFNILNSYYEAAKLQGFDWDKKEYYDEKTSELVVLENTQDDYNVLLARYNELAGSDGGGDGDDETPPYEISAYITEINTEHIDNEYMNTRFDKFMKLLIKEGTSKEALETAKAELHRSFAMLNKEQQKYANIILNDIHKGDITVGADKTFRELLTEYMANAQNDLIKKVADTFGLDEELLRSMKNAGLSEKNIGDFGRFDKLKNSVDTEKAKAYFDKVNNQDTMLPMVPIEIDDLLRKFICDKNYEIILP